MAIFFIICLLIQPWVFVPLANIADQFRLPQAGFMDCMFLGIIAMSFHYGNRLIYRNKYLSWFLGYVFFHLIFTFFIPFSTDIRNVGKVLNTGTLEPMLHLFLGLWVVQIILSNFEREDFIRIAKALCLSSGFISVFVILQYVGLDPLRCVNASYNLKSVSACLDNPNLVGMYLVLCLPLFLMFKEWKYKLGFILTILGLIVARCHFTLGLAAFSIGLYTIIRFRRNKWIWVVLFIACILGVLAIHKFDLLKLNHGRAMSGRFYIWGIGWEKFKENPLFGHGLGCWRGFGVFTPSTFGRTEWIYAHNDWLERAIEFGLIGIFLLGLVIVNAIKRFSYSNENLPYFCMFTTLLVMMVASFPWEVATIATLGVTSFCAVERL